MKEKKMEKTSVLCLTIVLTLSACAGSPSTPTLDINVIVQSTLQALTQQAVAPVFSTENSAVTVTPPAVPLLAVTATESSPSIPGLGGAVTGTLSYPSNYIPAMAVIAFRAGGTPTDYYYAVTNEGDSSYAISGLAGGEYYIVAYSLDNPALAGGYTQAVPCGLLASCTDHSLIPVPVANGGAVGDINPQDWYAPAGSFPDYPLP
jgi:hypothetical protein